MKKLNILQVTPYLFSSMLSVFFLSKLYLLLSIDHDKLIYTYYISLFLILFNLGFGARAQLENSLKGRIIFSSSLIAMFASWPNSFIDRYVYNLPIWGGLYTLTIAFIALIIVWFPQKNQTQNISPMAKHISITLFSIALIILTTIKLYF